MKRKVFSVVLTLIIGFACIAQPGKRFKTTEEGIKYKLHKPKSKEDRIGKGDLIKVHIITSTANDSTVFSTYDIGGEPVSINVKDGGMNASMMRAFMLLGEGDSSTIFIPENLVFENEKRPPYIKDGDYMKYQIKVLEVWTKAKLEQKRMEQAKTDEMLIVDYLAANNLESIKTASGLHYVVTEQGDQPKPQKGQEVSVHYAGKLLDGTEFDNSFKRGEPIEFPVGTGRVIKGWDEGLQLINVGSKATLLIPSGLAYGERGAGGGKIPADSVLIFDVEIVKAK